MVVKEQLKPKQPQSKVFFIQIIMIGWKVFLSLCASENSYPKETNHHPLNVIPLSPPPLTTTKKRHCQQNNRPCCCETISHHSLRYLDRPETQYSHHTLFSSEKLTWIPKCDVFCSIVGICKATCERICLTSGPVCRKWKCWKCVLCVGSGCRWRVSQRFWKSLRRSSIIREQETGWGFALFAFMGEL